MKGLARLEPRAQAIRDEVAAAKAELAKVIDLAEEREIRWLEKLYSGER